jgi:hypothetical protein
VLDVEKRENHREILPYIEHELEDRLIRRTPPEAPSAGRLSRQVRHFPIKPEVRIDSDEKGAHFILSLVAADRPGLLYTVATTLAEHGANLQPQDTTLANGPGRLPDRGADLRESASRIRPRPSDGAAEGLGAQQAWQPIRRSMIARPGPRVLQHRLQALEMDAVGAAGAAGRMVGDHVERRVRNLEFARQHGFRHAGHADHVGPVALQAVDLGRRLEARPLRRGIDGADLQRDAQIAAACSMPRAAGRRRGR